MRRGFLALAVVMLPGIALATGASKSDADHEIAAAKTSIDRAAALNDQWTSTIAAFRAAKAAARKGDFAEASAQAKRARGLADVSIEQAIEQKKLWHDEAVR